MSKSRVDFNQNIQKDKGKHTTKVQLTLYKV